MIFMLRNEACSGSIHDLAHSLTPNCLADCLTKASAKVGNLISAVRTGKLLDVDIQEFKNTCGTQGLLVHLVQNIHAHKGEGCFLLEHSQDLSYTNSPRRTISGDVCGDSADEGAKGIEHTRA